jgi:hypothetical protein
VVPEERRSSSCIAASLVDEIGPVLVHTVVHSDRFVLAKQPVSAATTSIAQTLHYKEDIPALHDSGPHDVGCYGQGPKRA